MSPIFWSGMPQYRAMYRSEVEIMDHGTSENCVSCWRSTLRGEDCDFITKTCPSNIWNFFLLVKIKIFTGKKFFTGEKFDIFNNFAQNIDCGYTY